MCERYAIPSQADAEREFLPVRCWWKFAVRFNVAPGQYVPAIRVHERETEGVMMRWGFIPAWAEGEAPQEQTAHVAAEQLDQLPIYRAAWLNSQRCVLPLAGFYVWRRTPAGYRQPFYVRVTDRTAFGVAGIWDRSTTEEDDVIESFAVITVPANPLLAGFGGESGERMPAILLRRDYATWLEGTPVRARPALQTYPSQWMQAYPVSPRVNSVKYDDDALIQPVG